MRTADLLKRTDFKLGEVADAAGVSPEAARNWLNRGLVMGFREDREGKMRARRGKARQFGFPTIMEFAVAQAIYRNGLSQSIEAAFSAAHVFAHHTGDDEPGAERFPSLPFATGETFLVFPSDGDAARVMLFSKGRPAEDLFPLLGEAVTVVDCFRVFINVCQRLGVNGWDVLKEAYSAAAPNLTKAEGDS